MNNVTTQATQSASNLHIEQPTQNSEGQRSMWYSEQEVQRQSPRLIIRHENSYPDIMTEAELIEYLRIPLVSEAVNFKYVIDNLIRHRDLPCIHLCRKRLFPLEMIRQWVASQQRKGAA